MRAMLSSSSDSNFVSLDTPTSAPAPPSGVTVTPLINHGAMVTPSTPPHPLINGEMQRERQSNGHPPQKTALGGGGAGAGPQVGGTEVWVDIPFRTLCKICLATPLLGLVACLAVAVIFQFEHIQETACKVFNVVPSISAVTGISPGRYLWRVVIAFHIGPRLLIALTYFRYLQSFLHLFDDSVSSNGSAKNSNSEESRVFLKKLLDGAFYLQVVEIVGLCSISFVHNREHYPIHEKGFLLYLASSHMLFLVVLAIYRQVWEHLTDRQKKSFYSKLYIFLFSTTSIALMAYFYYRHIKHCDNLAFSIFAFIEYFVAAANMGFYWTIVCDLPDERIIVMKPGANPRLTQSKMATANGKGNVLRAKKDD